MLLVLASPLAACDEDGGPPRNGEGPVPEPHRPARHGPAPGPVRPEDTRRARPPSAPPAAGSESEQGGAGDEEPIRTEAVVTARGGRMSPTSIRVPAFIAVRLELRSADARRYALRVGARVLAVGAGRRSAAVTMPGLLPGQRHVARPVGAGDVVVVEASGEPGP